MPSTAGGDATPVVTAAEQYRLAASHRGVMMKTALPRRTMRRIGHAVTWPHLATEVNPAVMADGRQHSSACESLPDRCAVPALMDIINTPCHAARDTLSDIRGGLRPGNFTRAATEANEAAAALRHMLTKLLM